VRRLRGFTLVEMLVAVAVLAIALAAILSGMARYAANGAALREKTIALWVAHNLLTQSELSQAWPDVGKSDGEEEMAGLKWKWTAEVNKTQDDHVRRIDVHVMRPGSKNNAISMSWYVADTGRQ
jgi:general secretion pathway protein I